MRTRLSWDQLFMGTAMSQHAAPATDTRAAVLPEAAGVREVPEEDG